MRICSAEKARNQAFRFLARRSRSEKELRDWLLKNYPGDITDQVIQNCKDGGYLNDEIFALERARQMALRGLKGNRAIATDLSGRGLGQTAITSAIQTIRRELSEGEAIEKLVAKKQKNMPVLGRHEKGKMGRYLLSRGFAANLVFEILNRRGFDTEYEEGVFYHDDGE